MVEVNLHSSKHEITKPIKERILSIDVLRGFDMFWIIGDEHLFSALFVLLGDLFEKYLDPQMHQKKLKL